MAGQTGIDWGSQRVIVTGGAGFLGRHIVEGLHARGVGDERIFIPRRKDYDLTEKDDCARLYADAFGGDEPTLVLHLAAEVGEVAHDRRVARVVRRHAVRR